MTCEVKNYPEPVFASCHCERCNGQGPLLCFTHFDQDACEQVETPEDLNQHENSKKAYKVATNKKPITNQNTDQAIKEEDKQIMKIKFIDKVLEQPKAKNCIIVAGTNGNFIKSVKSAENKECSFEARRRLVRKNVTMNRPDGSFYLGRRCKNEIKEILSIDQVFEVFINVHQRTIHGGMNLMAYQTKQYWNVTQKTIQIFKKLCPICAHKTKLATTSLVVNRIRTHSFASKGQLDLFDLQSVRYNGYNWVMQYQDNFCKLSVIRLLKTKRSPEILAELLKIFTLIGLPDIQQSENGKEFVNSILTELKILWPSVIIVNGRGRHSQSQGSVERANQDVKHMLALWCKENNTKDLTAELNFVYLANNPRPHIALDKKIHTRQPFQEFQFLELKCKRSLKKLRDAMTLGCIADEDEVFGITEEPDVTTLLSIDLIARSIDATILVEKVQIAQEKPAKRMLNISQNCFPDPLVGDNVALSIDKVDRGPLDFQTHMCRDKCI